MVWVKVEVLTEGRKQVHGSSKPWYYICMLSNLNVSPYLPLPCHPIFSQTQAPEITLSPRLPFKFILAALVQPEKHMLL